MDRQVRCGKRSGVISVPSSKSVAHRMLICSALAQRKSAISCDGISKDIAATIKCLQTLCADIDIAPDGCIRIEPKSDSDGGIRHLYCGESGSTLRFLLPVVGALGGTAVFHPEGLLASRPIDALADELMRHGVSITRTADTIRSAGTLTPGEYSIPGNISSQYISGLLFALPLLGGDSTIDITGAIESADYIAMTEDALCKSGIKIIKEGSRYTIPGGQRYAPPEFAAAEKDWSNAAFFLCMGALSEKGITLKNMPPRSKQGDKKIIDILRGFGAVIETGGSDITVRRGRLTGQRIDVSAIPDLVPTISALAASAQGTTEIVNAARLRYKESDRLRTTTGMLRALGADIEELADSLVIRGRPELSGGVIDAANDHRIAMAAAVAACSCTGDVTVMGAQCVNKSYPGFFDDLDSLEVYR